jgi:hypothetical protein
LNHEQSAKQAKKVHQGIRVVGIPGNMGRPAKTDDKAASRVVDVVFLRKDY